MVIYICISLTVFKDEFMLFHGQTSAKTFAVINAETTFLLAISELINCTIVHSYTKFENANALSLNCLNVETRCKISYISIEVPFKL